MPASEFPPHPIVTAAIHVSHIRAFMLETSGWNYPSVVPDYGSPGGRTIWCVPPGRRTSQRELRILKTIAEALNGATDVAEALKTTLEQVGALLNLGTGWIW